MLASVLVLEGAAIAATAGPVPLAWAIKGTAASATWAARRLVVFPFFPFFSLSSLCCQSFPALSFFYIGKTKGKQRRRFFVLALSLLPALVQSKEDRQGKERDRAARERVRQCAFGAADDQRDARHEEESENGPVDGGGRHVLARHVAQFSAERASHHRHRVIGPLVAPVKESVPGRSMQRCACVCARSQRQSVDPRGAHTDTSRDIGARPRRQSREIGKKIGKPY